MKKILLPLFISFVSLSVTGQISQGGQPYSQATTKLSNNIPIYVAPAIDLTPIKTEDVIADQHKDIPWRFGVEIPVNLSLNNSGLWENLPNGDRVWRLTIKVPNALSININYRQFFMPQNATFFLYNNKNILGAFTNANNKENREFSTFLTKGETVTLEYYEPASVNGQGIIELASIVHGYRDLFGKLKGFGGAGSCNVNAACDTAIWGDEIRSIVMQLTSGNSRVCSGSLINNTANDGTPYILTANHCSPSTNNIFMFNYQSPQCATNIDGPTTQTISGVSFVANNSPSDFFLLKLSATPPASYKVFYAGWNANNTPSQSSTGIHHPSGDVKKISHDFEPAVSSGYYGAGNDHWQVLDWNTGTTEGGSSGSPLFDHNHRIVGQLHGGNAACGNNEFDYYGKFSFSWDTNNDTLKQLKHWLDPNNTGLTEINGYDPNGSYYALDAATLSITGIEKNICGDTASPKITFINKGNSTLTSLTINVSLDGNTPSTTPWSGSLAPYQSTNLNLPALAGLSDGSHNYTVFTSNPNGSPDQNLANDTLTYTFRATAQPMFASLSLTTDNYGAETSWAVRDSSGAIVASGGGYPSVNGGSIINQDVCLSEKCYTFILYDAFGDGFCCNYGNGAVLLTETITGDTLFFNNTFNGDSVVAPFCLGNATGINENELIDLLIYPNPTQNNITINVGNNQLTNASIEVIDMTGRSLRTQKISNQYNQVNLSELSKGIYFILFHNNLGSKVFKVVKE